MRQTGRYGFSVPLCLCSLLALTPAAYAQGVTVEQFVALAIEQSPDLQAARTEIGVANGQMAQAALRPNPTLSSLHEHEPGGMMITGVDVEWPLDLFRRSARVAVAQRMADTTSLSIRDRERLLAREDQGLVGHRPLPVLVRAALGRATSRPLRGGRCRRRTPRCR